MTEVVRMPVNTVALQEASSQPKGATRWAPGQSGNPRGRPKGSRNKLAEAFIGALMSDFEEHGEAVIADVRRNDPVAYLAIISRVIPRTLTLPGDEPQKRQLCEYTIEELERLAFPERFEHD